MCSPAPGAQAELHDRRAVPLLPAGPSHEEPHPGPVSHGNQRNSGNLILLEDDELKPGETTVAQLRLDAPVAIVKGDHYVVRSYSPVRTVGGGQILNRSPQAQAVQSCIIQGLKASCRAIRKLSSASTSKPPVMQEPALRTCGS